MSLFFKGRRRAGLLAAGLLALTAAFRPAPPPPDELFRRVVSGLVDFYGTSLPEKAYLHLDRAAYASGETVWLRGYVTEADTHRPDTLSKVLYVELLPANRPQVLARRTLRLQGGLTHGDLALPDTLPTGTYQLRAYTSWMRNAGPAFFFACPLSVVNPTRPAASPAPATAVDVQFFPEGGDLVAGLESVVGFKAVDGLGRGVAVQGSVLDAQGQVVAAVASRHLGMGSFSLTPGAGQRYRARLALPGGRVAEYPLPASQPTGYALRVAELGDDFVVTIRQRAEPGAAPAEAPLLLAQVRGKVALAARVPLRDDAPFSTRIPKAKFLAGLAQFTLFDGQGVARCERLAFVAPPAGLRLTLTADKPAYAPHEAVRLRLKATDATGQPLAGDFSVAVAAAGLTAANGPGIVSYLLLTSDLAGYVEDPGYYFREPAAPDARLALNDLLLTQGWRRFTWQTLLAGQRPGREFALEQGLTLAGQVLTAAGQPAAAHQVAYLQTAPAREGQVVTAAAGRFLFRGFDGLDTAYALLRAQPARGERDLRISLPGPPPAPGLPAAPESAFALAYAERLRRQPPLAVPDGAARTVALGAVQVRGQRPAPDDHARTYLTTNVQVLQVPPPALLAESRTVLQYLRTRSASISTYGDVINIRHQASYMQNPDGTNGFRLDQPLFLLDGAVIPADVFTEYPIREVQSIDILTQSAAAVFGTQGAAGVIALHSRHSIGAVTANEPVSLKGAVSVQVPGYYRAREFYAPRYPAAVPAPDARAGTLYWAPTVRTDATGQAELTFFTADAPGDFQATAEGLGQAGQPLHGRTGFVVR